MIVKFAREAQEKSTLIVFIAQDRLQTLNNYPIEAFDFQAKFKEVLEVKNFAPHRRLILVGLGEQAKINAKTFMNAGGFVADLVSKEKSVAIEIKSDFNMGIAIENIALGMKLKSYSFDKYISNSEDKKAYKINEITFLHDEVSLKNTDSLVQGVNFARDLINEPANVLYPKSYVERILELRNIGLDVEILEKTELEKIGMGSLLSVNQGSDKEPYVAILKYNGNPAQTSPIAFVGKGVTFDSGGYSLKPAAGMMDMKKDMTGSAVVVGLMQALALRQAKVNAIGVIGLVENMVNGSATRPGDIVKSLSGKTIEILNTDAEGRLVLADILYYTQSKYKPEYMINLATLTGAMIIALGGERAGLFSNSQELADKIKAAGDSSGEMVWQLPMGEEYSKHLKSPIADLQNISTVMKGAGSIFAAMFLKEFVGDTSWAHLDIAGVASNTGNTEIDRKGCVAFGIRLLNDLVVAHYEK
ncbi:MAG: leucyl aminopeptidase [Alphaproteobacteria bacterium]|jgi:leucyl aminopeptidase|nr:leucyl aminopeptidase [Alphaproteobacteria bacterium]